MHPIDKGLMYILVIILSVITCCSIYLHNETYHPAHNCGDTQCVYNGITEMEWKEAVIKQVGEEGTDSFFMDILHLEYPHKTADEREDMLFKRSNL